MQSVASILIGLAVLLVLLIGSLLAALVFLTIAGSVVDGLARLCGGPRRRSSTACPPAAPR
jgi:hypothetical protein